MTFDEGVEWLRAYLGDRIHLHKDVQYAAKAAGMGIGRLKVSRAALGVRVFRKEPAGPFYMCAKEVEHQPCESGLPPPRPSLTDAEIARLLYLEWQDSGSSTTMGLFDQVDWVANRLLQPMRDLRVGDIPCGAALSLLLWAQGHENEFRQMYDCKRMERVAARPAGKSGSSRSVGAGRATAERMMNRNGG